MPGLFDIGRPRDTRSTVWWLALQVVNGPLHGLRVAADGTGRLFVGRARNCQLQVIDLRMSREHFLAEYSEGCWKIHDLASSNGTFVNEQRIDGVTEVRNGDLLTAGDTVFAVTIGERVVERPDSDQMPGATVTQSMLKTKSTPDCAAGWFRKTSSDPN